MVKTAGSLFWSREGHLRFRFWSRVTVAPRQRFNIHLSAPPASSSPSGWLLFALPDRHSRPGCRQTAVLPDGGVVGGFRKEDAASAARRVIINFSCLGIVHPQCFLHPSPPPARHPLGSGGKLRADFRRGGRNHQQDYLALGILFFFTKACLSQRKKQKKHPRH